jgi:hypothetical protein
VVRFDGGAKVTVDKAEQFAKEFSRRMAMEYGTSIDRRVVMSANAEFGISRSLCPNGKATVVKSREGAKLAGKTSS